MNIRNIIALACVALAFAARADYQPMASKALLEKRITEVNTNINAKLAKLRDDVRDMIDARYAVETNTSEIAKKNADIMTRLMGYELRGADYYYANCTNIGAVVEYSSTAKNLRGTYMTWDKTWHNKYAVATNAFANVAAWQKSFLASDGTVTNAELFVTTGDGERYNLSTNSNWKSRRSTYICTTNDTRKIDLRHVLLDDVSHRILLGKE